MTSTERKRKLPARAAARVEQANKRRLSTPPGDSSTTRSATPTLSTADDSAQSQPPSQLPKSIQAGKPLPTVEKPQPDDLPASDYQSVHESGVLAESLLRSRQKWISEGIFDKYWAKPSKRRGVAVDDPKNPPKDSMVKLGQVIITVEPHVFEATMYGVKDPKPAAALPPNVRPIIMYGPSRGAMPPPPLTPKQSQSPAQTPKTAAVLPGPPAQTTSQPVVPQLSAPLNAVLQPPATAIATATATAVTTTATQPPTFQPPQPPPPPPSLQQQPQEPPRPEPQPSPVPAAVSTRPIPSPRGMEAILSPSAPPPAARPLVQSSPPAVPAPGLPGASLRGPSPAITPGHPPAANPQAPSPSPPAGQPKAPAGTDSIIITLAERATEDPQLRDLMKRVANGNAPQEELDRFQVIIEQITRESRRNGATQGPSADRLLVDGRTVRFFAEEVRIILDIVLRTNPKQTSANLHPPAGSDPLVVLLVKTALDDVRVRDIVRRIGENRPHFSDATDLKAVLDRLKGQVSRSQPLQPAQPAAPVAGTAAGISPAAGKANGPSNNAAAAASSPAALPQTGLPNANHTAHHHQHGGGHSGQQALRSKGPPPAPKVDVSAVLFEFAGGTGDRYLFPKFSIVEHTTAAQGRPEVVASFLIVRKGSASEYGGDPDLDYYQPVTIRLQVAPQSSNQKLLDYLGRVTAPADEVKRYMDNIMNNMTRAEYVLLAMRLPRKELPSPEGEEDGEKMEVDGGREKDRTPAQNGYASGQPSTQQPMQGVLWTATASTPHPGMTTATASSSAAATPQQKTIKRIVEEEQQYQTFIAKLTPKDVDEV